MGAIYLKKGCGRLQGYNIDMKHSKCVNLIQFKYAIVVTSSENSPCMNVPIICQYAPQSRPQFGHTALILTFATLIAFPVNCVAAALS